MQSHSVHKAISSHCFFDVELLKKHIQSYDGAGPPDSSTRVHEEPKVRLAFRWTLSAVSAGKPAVDCLPAVNHSWCWCPFCLHVLSHQSSELYQHLCGEWDSVVRPDCEVKMLHSALLRGVSLWTHSHSNSASFARFFPVLNQCLQAFKRIFLPVLLWIFSESSWTPPARILWWPAALRTDKACSLQASIFHT